jgi:hypothetical protein
MHRVHRVATHDCGHSKQPRCSSGTCIRLRTMSGRLVMIGDKYYHPLSGLAHSPQSAVTVELVAGELLRARITVPMLLSVNEIAAK